MYGIIKKALTKKNKISIHGTAHIEINPFAEEIIRQSYRKEIEQADVVYFESDLLTKHQGINKRIDTLLRDEAEAQGKIIKYLETDKHAIGFWGRLVIALQWTVRNTAPATANEEMIQLFLQKDHEKMRDLAIEITDAPDFYLNCLKNYLKRDKNWKKPKEKNVIAFVGAMHVARLEKRWN